MSLNKASPLTTVKAKLTLFYVVLFMVTQFLCALVIYFCQQHSVLSNAKKKVAIFSDEFTHEYMTGEELTSARVHLPLDAVAKETMEAIVKFDPDFIAESACVNSNGDTLVLGSANGIVYGYTSKRDNPSAVSRKEYTVSDRIGLLNDEFNEESYGENVNQIYFLLVSPTGAVHAKSGFTEVGAALFTDYKLKHGRESQTVKLSYGREGILSEYRRLFDGNVLVIGAHMHPFNKYTVNLLYSILATLGLSFLVSLLSGRFIADRFVHGIKRITYSARKIESGNYSERVAQGNEGAEISNLVDAFNDMTNNTEKLLSELKTISDNMAHDLRTPITRMRGMAEMSLGNSKDNELASDVAEECANMLTMINAMLEITQTECNLGNPVRTPLDFAALAGDTVNLLSTVADDKGVSIKTDIPETALPFIGNKVQLQRLIANLLDNAIKFTPSGGAVSVSVKQDDGNVLLTVADTGCGIPEKDRGHVFDRFYRSDASRNISGNGLGLSLVKATVDSYGGEISFSSEEGRGTVFTLTLPKRRPVGEEV